MYFTGRAPQLPPTTTFAELAAGLADGIADQFDEPVDILGHSTGGSLVLETVADRPEVVGRAHHLADGFTQNRMLQRLLAIPMRLASLVKVPDAADPIAVLRAEDKFDVYDRLPGIRTATLVIGGARDYFYSPEMFAETARLIPHGEVIVYPKRGHNIVTSKRFVSDVVSFLERPATA